MQNLTASLREHLLAQGATLVGFADVSALPERERCGLPCGVAVAIKYEKDVIRSIADHPTPQYHDAYQRLNARLDAIVTDCAEWLQRNGYAAVARTLDFVGKTETDHASEFPHKTVARLAGLGWIGKSALFVTEEYGSMIRLSTVMTDAPLTTATPVDVSRCGDCMVCVNACPAGAVQGKNWTLGSDRDDIFDAVKCRKTARALSDEYISDTAATICGRCLYACPHTQKYLKEDTK